MAGTYRQSHDSVVEDLVEHSRPSRTEGGPEAHGPSRAAHLRRSPREYSFYAAVRLLHAAFPEAPKIGYDGPPERERIRLRPTLDVAFPISDIDSVEEFEAHADSNRAPRFVVNVSFMGLYGASSPLPNHYTEDLLRREEFDSTLRGYLDLFHHRLLSLLYRAWEKYRHGVQYRTDAHDWYSRRLLALGGVLLDHVPGNAAIASGRLLEYVGLLSMGASAESLRAMLSAHFPEVRVEIEQCVGAWTGLADDQTSSLGAANCSLGADAVLGRQVFNRSGAFGVNMGPMALESYLALLPGESDLNQLRELVDIINSDGLEYEVTLALRGDEVSRAMLGSSSEGGRVTTRLGWCSWLGESSGEDRSVTFRFRGWRRAR